MESTYIAWRADQVLYSSCTLDIYCDNVGLHVFTQNCEA